MSEVPVGPRRYGEREVSRLLKRATELQRARPMAPEPSGLTLSELEEIAVEAGIDPDLLRRAAGELDHADPADQGLGSALAGAATRILLERTLPFEAPHEVFSQLVPTIQMAADAPGQASQVGSALTWHSHTQSNPRSLQVIVTVQPGQTLIRIEERYGPFAGALFGGVLGGVGGGLGLGLGIPLGGLLGSVAIGVAFPVTVLAGSYVACRGIFRRIVRKRNRALRALLDTLVEQLTVASDAARRLGPAGPTDTSE